jgi:hypothetical protein
MSSVISGNLLLSLTFSYALSSLWGVANTLQIIVHIPLLQLSLPANIMSFLAALLDCLNFNLVNPDNFHQKIYNLKNQDEYPAPSNNYKILGYKTSNFIYNMGGSFLILEFYIVAMPLI